eukprot:6202087-Pleurochrysis_carterae.AAC.4
MVHRRAPPGAQSSGLEVGRQAGHDPPGPEIWSQSSLTADVSSSPPTRGTQWVGWPGAARPSAPLEEHARLQLLSR